MSISNSTNEERDQITLEFLTTDERLIEIARAYWEFGEDGKWIKTSEIENRLEISRGRVPSIVAPICLAYSSSVRCTQCNHLLGFNSRAKLDEELRMIKQKRRGRCNYYEPICSACQEDSERKQLAAIVAKARAAELAIKSELDFIHEDPHTLDYSNMTLRQGFLLDGLLRSAGDCWRGETLDAWTEAKVKLCDTEEDIRSVYRELYRSSWLRPCSTNSLDLFTVGENDQLVFDELKVRWNVAADKFGLLFNDILKIADLVQKEATPEQLRPIWEWVCLCELKGHFYWCHKDWDFKSRGWTLAMERGALDLLSVCSIGSAKLIMKRCCKNIASELQKRSRPAAHTYNMLPGNLRKTFDFYIGAGWQVNPYNRQNSSVEPIFTSHLFDRLLKSGNFGYRNLNGNSFSSIA